MEKCDAKNAKIAEIAELAEIAEKIAKREGGPFVILRYSEGSARSGDRCQILRSPSG
jgi:hypothetical protein